MKSWGKRLKDNESYKTSGNRNKLPIIPESSFIYIDLAI